VNKLEITITDQPTGRKVKAHLLACSICEGTLFSIAKPVGTDNVRVKCVKCGAVCSDRSLPGCGGVAGAAAAGG
jgi:hypothetical protein